ncbi:TPA: DNA primase regulatory subunit PriL [Candidatus Bathyarchaeota archaeon]|nr:DNA primase regulatory subunit PriL [Candidatus Bathyarchaeota archaeon]
MTLTRADIAKYPFLTDAAEEVKRESLDIQSLDNPELGSIIKRAIERIEEALKNNPPQISYRRREEDTEIPSFPVAIIIAAASGSNYIKRRYALAEAMRAYELLREEKKEKFLEIAKTFNWRIRCPEKTIGGRRFDFALFFTDYLRNTKPFHESGFKLVNRPLLKGEIFLTKREAARLLREEIRRKIEKRLDADVRSKLPEILLNQIDELKKKYANRMGEILFEEFPKETVEEAFPPCIGQLFSAAKAGRHISHLGRFTLTSFLLNVGMKPSEVVDIFRSSSDFNERLTRYQVEHIAGSRGSGTKYVSPSCETLKTHGLCPGSYDLCRGIKHPLTGYRRRMRTFKKES